MPAGKLTLNPELTFQLPGRPTRRSTSLPARDVDVRDASPLKKAVPRHVYLTSDGKNLTVVDTVSGSSSTSTVVVPSEMPKTGRPRR